LPLDLEKLLRRMTEEKERTILLAKKRQQNG